MKLLNQLKEEYKAATGQAWKPDSAPAAAAPAATVPAAAPATAAPAAAATGSGSAQELNAKIAEQGNKVRDVKAAKAAKVF